MSFRNQVCPYTCQPIETIDFNREHIVPDALGGPEAFCLAADRTRNSAYGSSVDARLIGSTLMGMLAARAGVATRNGQAAWKAKGHLVADGSSIEVVGRKDAMAFRFRKPVEVDQETRQVRLVKGFGCNLNTELARVQKDLRRKGLDLVAGVPHSLPSSVHGSFEHNLAEATQGLIKIAYLATVWALGDGFVRTSAGALYRSWLDAKPTSEALSAAGLRPLEGSLFKMPGQPAQHDIVCVAAGQTVVTGVRLFNEPLFEIAIAVEVLDFGLPHGHGCLVTIDAGNKTFNVQRLVP
jgi:hypothetical protein